MSTKKTSGSTNRRVLGPDTFDFNAYVEGKSTFPEESHTVYLDQKNGLALAKVKDDCAKVAVEIARIEERLRQVQESSSLSFVDDRIEILGGKLQELSKQAQELDSTKRGLEELVLGSRLILNFQAGTPEKMNSLLRKTEKDFIELHGAGSDDDEEYATLKNKYALSAQLAAYCTKVTAADGREGRPPGAAGFAGLLEHLIPSEFNRLTSALIECLNSSDEWAEDLDAGFPGGGADVAGQPVGGTGDQDGPVVGRSAAGAPDRGGI